MIDKIQNIMKKQLSSKEKTILSITIGIWGIVLIGSGLILNAQNRTITKTIYNLDVSQKRVAQQRTNEIKLKDMEIEINTPLSTDIKDYLEDIDNLDESIFDYLKLDTSTVKISEAGEYTYTVTYRKKKYNGTIKVKEKELPNVQLQLKLVELPINSSIPVEKTAYISTPLTEEMKASIQLDISKVNIKEVGEYPYTIVYNKTTYMGIVKVYVPKPKTQGDEINDANNKDKEKDKEENTTTT